MAKTNSKLRARFFWQGLFVLLPMLALTAVGLWSLRQDRLLAEQDARQSAEILSQRIFQNFRTEGVQLLRDFSDKCENFHANRVNLEHSGPFSGIDLTSPPLPGGVVKIRHHIRAGKELISFEPFLVSDIPLCI